MFLSNQPATHISIVLRTKDLPTHEYFLRLPEKSYSVDELIAFSRSTLLSYSVDSIKRALTSLLNNYDANVLSHYDILVYSYDSNDVLVNGKVYYVPLKDIKLLHTFKTVEEVRMFLRG